MTLLNKSTKTLLLGTSMLVLPAFTQTAAAAVTEMVVSAERRDASIQTVPIAVTAFSADDIENLQIINVTDIGATVPNMVSRNSSGQATNVTIFMRGQGQNESTMPTAESAVGIYIDDVYQARTNGSNIELLDIERIEVLRAPQGTLYGRNTIAGALKFVTRKPGDETRVAASLGYGTREHIQAKLSASGPVVEGKLALGAAVVYSDQEGYYDRYSGTTKVESDIGDRQYAGIRADLNYYGSENFEFNAHIAYTEDDTDASYVTPLADFVLMPAANNAPLSGDFYGTQTTDQQHADVEQLTASINMTWKFDGFDLKSITGYRDVEQDSYIDISGSNGWYIDSLVEGTQITQEIQLIGSTENVDWILGAFYLNEDNDTDSLNILAGGLINSRQIYTTETQSYAVFGQATYNVNDQLGLTAGLRWTQDEKEFSGGTGGFPPWGEDYGIMLDDSWDQVQGKLGIDYQVDDDTLLYFSVSQGFMAGGYQARAVRVADVNTPYDEATVISYEAGIKTELADNRIRLNANYFYADYEDIQENALNPMSSGTIRFNVGDAIVQGLEAEMQASPTDNLNIFANLAITDSEYRNLRDEALAVGMTPGHDVAGTPDAMGGIGFDYTVNLANEGSIVMGGDYRYQKSHWPGTKQNAPGTKVEELNLVNGFIRYEMPGGNFDVGVYVRNLNDDEHIYTGFDFGTFDSAYAAEPRSVMLKANFRM